jgi:hypothetical protein
LVITGIIALSMVWVEKTSVVVEVRIPYKVLVGEHAGRDNFEEYGVNVRAVLILILDKQGGKFLIVIGFEVEKR